MIHPSSLLTVSSSNLKANMLHVNMLAIQCSYDSRLITVVFQKCKEAIPQNQLRANMIRLIQACFKQKNHDSNINDHRSNTDHIDSH